MRKQIQAILLTLIALALAACAGAAEVSTAPQPEVPVQTEVQPAATDSAPAIPSEMDELDTEMFQRLSELYALFRENAAEIWGPSFRLDQDSIYLVRNDGDKDLYGYIINHPNPESIEGATAVNLPADLNLPPVHRVTQLNTQHLSAIPNYEFEYQLGDAGVMMMKYNPPDVDSFSAPTSFDWSLYLAHEVFHRFQMRNMDFGYGNQDLSNYDFSAESIALMLLENRILRAGLAASDEAGREAALKQFLAVRSLRLETYGQQVHELDNLQEQAEGTARYIEHRLGELINYSSSNLSTFGQFLGETEFPGAVRDTLGFGRFYDTGAALSHLLDLQGIDWKGDLASGESHYDILLREYGLENRDELVAAAKAEHDFASLLTAGVSAAESAAEEPVNIFEGEEVAGDMGDAEGEYLEFPQKPFGPARADLVPEGYSGQGYSVEADELDAFLKEIYSPSGNPVDFVELDADGDKVGVYASKTDMSLEDYQTSLGSFAGSVERLEQAGQQFLAADYSEADFNYAVVSFLRNGELINVEGPLPLAEILAIAVSLATSG